MRVGPADTAARVLVVAEIGNNHEGDPGAAHAMVDAAADAGAGAVKLQAIEPRELVRPSDEARLAQLERFRLSPEDFAALSERSRSRGLAFLCTPFSLAAVEWLDPLVDAWKIASGDNDFFPLIEAVAADGKPVIISTGLADADGIAAARERVRAAGDPPLALLHCASLYPLPAEQANLAAIPLLAGYGAEPGYSDHVLGIDACLVAAAQGARVIEKHFTLERGASDFRDHELSAVPEELAELVRRLGAGELDVPEAEVLRGTATLEPVPQEAAAASSIRRSIAVRTNLEAGHELRIEDLAWLRPRDGLPPGEEARVLGRVLSRRFEAGETVLPDDLR